MTVNDQEDLSNTIAIIGAGPAGCVLANRLLNLTRFKIMLLERGYDQVDSEDVTNLERFPKSLAYHATGEDSTVQSGLSNRFVSVTTAMGVGGGTLVNAGMFLIGSKEDWDYFPPDDVERAVAQVVKKHQPKKDVKASYTVKDSPAATLFENLAEKNGLDMKHTPTLWTDEDGIFEMYVSTPKYDESKIERQSVAETYLAEIMDSPRFTLIKGATVKRILVDEESASGFEYTVASKMLGLSYYTSTKTLKGFRQVILCAGAIESSRILLQSGIGPSQELTDSGIPVVCDNAHVGKNLWDHPIIPIPIHTSEQAETPSGFPAAGPAGAGSVALETVDNQKKLFYYTGHPIVVHTMPGDIMVPKFQGGSTVKRFFQVKMLDVLRPVIYNRNDTKLGFAAVGLLSITSRGSVKVDPTTKQVVVDPAYLATQDDREALAQGLDHALKIMRENSMSVPVPDFDMDPDDLVEAASVLAGPAWHYGGSCALGKALDNNFGVKGVSKLRVVDASSFPKVIQANTQASVMVLAHLAVERIAKEL